MQQQPLPAPDLAREVAAVGEYLQPIHGECHFADLVSRVSTPELLTLPHWP